MRPSASGQLEFINSVCATLTGFFTPVLRWTDAMTKGGSLVDLIWRQYYRSLRCFHPLRQRHTLHDHQRSSSIQILDINRLDGHQSVVGQNTPALRQSSSSRLEIASATAVSAIRCPCDWSSDCIVENDLLHALNKTNDLNELCSTGKPCFPPLKRWFNTRIAFTVMHASSSMDSHDRKSHCIGIESSDVAVSWLSMTRDKSELPWTHVVLNLVSTCGEIQQLIN